MNPPKKQADSEKTATIIKIKLSDMLGASSKPIEEEEDEQLYSSSPPLSSSEMDEEIGPEAENSIENDEELSNFDQDNSVILSASNVSQTNNMKPPSKSNQALSEIAALSHTEDPKPIRNLDSVTLPLLTELNNEIKKEKTGIIDSKREKIVAFKEDPWSYRKQPPKQKYNNILVDYTALHVSNSELSDISLQRASTFNDYLLTNRKRIKEITKAIERQKLSQRFALDNSNSVFPSLLIPLIRHDPNEGSTNYDSNGCLELEKENLQKFIDLNVANEHNIFEHPSKFAMFYPRRFQRRRRRRRNANKNGGPNDPQPDSPGKNL